MKSRSRNIMIAVFTIPAMIAIALVFVYPVIRTILMSFFTIDNVVSKMSEWSFVGVSNYTQLLGTPLFRQTWVTFAKISAVALANMWIHYAYNANWGLFHNIFAALGWDSMAQFQWTSPDHLFLAMMVAYCFGAVGYYMLIYIAEIEKIPQDIFEAAKIDGSSGVHSFFHITLPLFKGVFKTTLTLWTTGTLGFYIWSQMFSSNRDASAQIMTPMYYMIRTTFGDMASAYTETNAGLGAAICVMVMLAAGVAFAIISRIFKGDEITF